MRALILLLVPHLAFAADTWVQQNGPYGSLPVSFAADPNNPGHFFFGTSRHGLYESDDGGQTWTDISDPLFDNEAVFAIVLGTAGCAKPRLFIGTSDGVYEGDGGSGAYVWTKNSPLGSSTVLHLVGDPAKDVLYAESNGTVFIGALATANCSNPRVATWTEKDLPSAVVTEDLMMDFTSTPATLFAIGPTTGGNTVYTMAEGAGSWTTTSMTSCDEGLLFDLGMQGIACRVLPIQITVDHGGTWNPLPGTSPPSDIVALASNGTDLFASAGQTLYEQGSPWAALYPFLESSKGLFFDPNNAQNIFSLSGTSEGMLTKSTDGGSTFALSDTGILEADVSDIAVLPDGSFVAAVANGVVTSSDGDNWTRPANAGTGFASGGDYLFAIDPHDGKHWWIAGIEIFDSIDAGATWKEVPDLPDLGSYTSLVVHDQTFDLSNGYYLRSADSGQTWTQYSLQMSSAPIDVEDAVTDPSDPTTVYGLSNGPVVGKISGTSIDFSAMGSGISGVSLYEQLLVDLDASPLAMYLLTDTGTWKSVDKMQSWQLIAGSPNADQSGQLSIDPTTHSIFAAGNQVWRSTNGTCWANLTSDLPSTGDAGKVVVDPNNQDHVLLASISHSVLAMTLDLLAPPRIDSISPAPIDPAGGAVTVTGGHFRLNTTVTLGGTVMEATIANDGNSLTFTAPAAAIGSVPLTIDNPGLGATDCQDTTKAFVYGYPAPTLTGISPTGGPAAGGTAVTLAGTNFMAGATVSIGGAAATSVQVVSATSLTAVTPAGSGSADVVVTNTDNQTATLSPGFSYLASNIPSPISVTPTPTTAAKKSGCGCHSAEPSEVFALAALALLAIRRKKAGA